MPTGAENITAFIMKKLCFKKGIFEISCHCRFHEHTPFLLPEWVRHIKDEDKEKGTCITH